jgi:hypothetical protein
MVNGSRHFRRCCAVWLLGVVVMTAAAWSRSAEYDEQYTLFLTAGTPRPAWPDTAFPAGLAPMIQSQQTDLGTIARDLRRTDVHPPVYFWAVALWRRMAGDGLFAARLLSVGFSLAALALVGVVAWQVSISPALAMLLTLGCYGFVYTGSVTRGFALAQMLNIGGVACVLAARGRRGYGLAAGSVFGAAAAANYLAVFVAAGVALARPRAVRFSFLLGFLPFLALDAWYFAAQHDSRVGQFPPFRLLDYLGRLAGYTAANVFGGLPLYLPDAARPSAELGLAALMLALAGLVILRWRHIGTRACRHILVAAALAPPVGLLGLGVVFNNTPIELRYLSFATPFMALLVAGAMASVCVEPAGVGMLMGKGRPRRARHGISGCEDITNSTAGGSRLPVSWLPVSWPAVSWPGLSRPPTSSLVECSKVVGGRPSPAMTQRCAAPTIDALVSRRTLIFHWDLRSSRTGLTLMPATPLPYAILVLTLAVQAAAIAGLMLRPETMQPARATAAAARALVGKGAILLPYGNDGVGIVGAFALESPPDLPLILVRSAESISGIRRRIVGYQRVVVAELVQDADSHAAVPIMKAALAGPCWHPVAEGFNVIAYDRLCAGE